MKAVVRTRYGPPEVLRYTDLPTPEPRRDEVLVRVQAVSLNRSDWEGLTGRPAYARIMGVVRPRRHVLGSDLAGRVVATGPDVTRFRAGDDVFADALNDLGGLAEHVCLPQDVVAAMPDGLGYDEAACLPQAGVIALQGVLDKGQVGPGQRVLVNGAGGGSGMYAIQLAKLHGAEVTAVDNGEKLEFMRSLGADHVIDHTTADFTRNGLTYDLVLDLVARRSVRAVRRSLAPGGQYFFVGGSVPRLLEVLLLGRLVGRRASQRIRLLVVAMGAEHVARLADLCRTGQVVTRIDRRFPLSEAAEALRYLGGDHAKGKVVVVPDEG